MKQNHALRAFIHAVILALLAFLGAVATAHASREHLYFIGSEEELTKAFEADQKGEIGSIAIDQHFYFGSASKTKARMRALAAHVFELRDRTVYMYGLTLNLTVVESFLNLDKPVWCKEPFYVGKRLNSTMSDKDSPRVCGMMGKTESTTDEHIRVRILYDHYNIETPDLLPGTKPA